MLGVEEVVEVAFTVGGIARSHQGFSSGGDRVAVKIPLAAISVMFLGAAGAKRIEEHIAITGLVRYSIV